jgi:hypothetical protein
MGQNAERQETGNHPRRPLRDENFPGEIKLPVNFFLPLAGCWYWIKVDLERHA